jgi:hypothetical protein
MGNRVLSRISCNSSRGTVVTIHTHTSSSKGSFEDNDFRAVGRSSDEHSPTTHHKNTSNREYLTTCDTELPSRGITCVREYSYVFENQGMVVSLASAPVLRPTRRQQHYKFRGNESYFSISLEVFFEVVNVISKVNIYHAVVHSRSSRRRTCAALHSETTSLSRFRKARIGDKRTCILYKVTNHPNHHSNPSMHRVCFFSPS